MPVPDDRWYSEDHQWVQPDGEFWRVGLTDYAQEALGEVTMVQFLETDEPIEAGAEMGEVEAFKAMTDLYMPVEAAMIEVNGNLATTPTAVNDDPYGTGWLCRIRPVRSTDVDGLLDADRYRSLIGAD